MTTQRRDTELPAIDATVTQRIRDTFVDAGCAGWLHATTIGRTPEREICWHADEPVVLASVYKLPLLIALCRMFDSGEIDPAASVRVDPAQCSSGPTGIALLHHPITISWRDLAVSMMVVSDNAAADVILDAVGLDRVGSVLADAGLSATRVVSGMAQLHRIILSETGTSTVREAFAVLASRDFAQQTSTYDAATASAGTPRESSRLLSLVWTDRLASTESCEFIRDTMRGQVFRQRIASGFPSSIDVAGKTGTLGAIRNEIAVVEYPGEYPIAVSVFTRAARSDMFLPIVDAAIGTCARVAVSQLRATRTQ